MQAQRLLLREEAMFYWWPEKIWMLLGLPVATGNISIFFLADHWWPTWPDLTGVTVHESRAALHWDMCSSARKSCKWAPGKTGGNGLNGFKACSCSLAPFEAWLSIQSIPCIETNLSLVRVSYALRIAPPERWNHPLLRKTPVLWSSSHVS